MADMDGKLTWATSIVNAVRAAKIKGRKTPHKHLFLLALARLYHENPNRENRFPLDATLEETFRTVGREELGTSATEALLVEYPFYHLVNDGVWHLQIAPGMQSVFESFRDSPHTRLTKRRLMETVAFGYLSPELDVGFRDTRRRQLLCDLLRQQLGAASVGGEGSHTSNRTKESSLFEHEAEWQQAIMQAVLDGRLGETLVNLELHDRQSNRYFEVDLVIVAAFGIYAVELKHWSGSIVVRPHSWLQNDSFYKADPHKANNHKAKLIRGLYEHRFPHFPGLYAESVVVLTNPEATVEGSSSADTTKHNPTFAGVEAFITYLKHQRHQRGSVLTDVQVQAFAEYLAALHSPGPPRDFIFPGYEIVERLAQHEDRAELIARRTDVRHRQLSRLRIYFPPSGAGEADRVVFQERATATLNAVAKTGEHPNILKVWAVPNESGYIVEGSDWSDAGTLQDVIHERGQLTVEEAKSIAVGILRGLDALHQQGVIHRALSPDAILMVNDVPRLTNFDLSYQLEEDRVTVIADASALKRTPYIAPEVYSVGSFAETADLFSVGVILYQMLTAERPFSCSTDLERTGGKLGDAQQRKVAAIDDHLAALIVDLTRLEPAARPAQAAEVLEQLLPREAIPAGPPEINPLLAPGDSSGLYEVEQRITTSAQAQLYLARGPRAARVVIKLFNQDVPLERVVREHRSLGAVRHPSIVGVDNYGQWDDGRFYIAMHWLDGLRLREEIDKAAPPEPRCFGLVATRLLDALIALHGHTEDDQLQPILHNDIKPENVVIVDGDRPVLIDFGSASPPQVSLYEGTEGYVAPDLRQGQDRDYCEGGDLYALGVTLKEWFFSGHRSDADEVSTLADVDGKRLEQFPRLLNWFRRSTGERSAKRFSSAEEMRQSLDSALADSVEPTAEVDPTPVLIPEPESPVLARPAEEAPAEADAANPFVVYLNSMHCRGAGSEAALAEGHARHQLSGLLHVPRPLTDIVQRALLEGDRQHVVLTGHAGDGKTTVALELYKRALGIPVDSPLQRDLQPREDLVMDGKPICIIKDFSEWPLPQRLAVLDEMAESNGPRFLLVSNTGTMLASFGEHALATDADRRALESRLLELLSKAEPQQMDYHTTRLLLLNLSMVDSLRVAEQLFERIIAPERWEWCQERACNEHCIIFRNFALMHANRDVVRERIFLAYRRLHEYGTRLTLRQLSAHLAYMVTSGQTCSQMEAGAHQAHPTRMSEAMFYNRFFGDNGRDVDKPALQLRAVRAVRDQHFGLHPSPTWERRLWLQSEGLAFSIEAQGCAEEFEQLRQIGAGGRGAAELSEAQARRQARRMLFFLHRGDDSPARDFVRSFLNSPCILDFARWQRSEETLALGEKGQLERSILHVLQEHFTGVRLPEGAPNDGSIFVTLSRRSREIRQSAQVVLAHFPDDAFELRLVSVGDSFEGPRRELVLAGRGSLQGIRLPLCLPFLDYVTRRHRGDLGEGLQASHVDRLERLKGELLGQACPDRDDELVLIRLRTNHTFRRQIYAIRGDRMEVTDG